MKVGILLVFTFVLFLAITWAENDDGYFDLMEAESDSDHSLNRQRRFFNRFKNLRSCWKMSKDPTFVENQKNRAQYKHYKNRYLLKDNNYVKHESCYCKEK